MKRTLTILVLCGTWLAAGEWLLGYLAQGTALAQRQIDIQHPTELLAKLDYLRQFSGRKIVLLGDSLVYGGILEEFGDREWRNHDLAHALEVQCRQRWPDEPVLVMNLGINGALPCDLERLAQLVTNCRVDCVVFDIHLRPFAQDFARESSAAARPWLTEITVDPSGRAGWRPISTARFDPQPSLSAWLSDHSALFRYRKLFQSALLDSTAIKNLAVWRRPAPPSSENDQQMQTLIKLGQLKQRLRQIALDDTNPQVAAFQRMLALLAERNQPFVVFYAKENPELLESVFESERHAELYARLTRLIATASRGQGTFVPPLDELRSDHFLDFTHLNSTGYELLARRLSDVLPGNASMPAAIARVE